MFRSPLLFVLWLHATSQLLPLSAQAVAPTIDIVRSGEQLQSAVQNASDHIIVRNHLDMTYLSPMCTEVFLPWVLLCYWDARDVSIRGDCPNTFSGGGWDDKSLPFLKENQCVIEVRMTWLMTWRTDIWLHNLHVRLRVRDDRSETWDRSAEGNIFFVPLVDVGMGCKVWLTSVGLQGDGGAGELLEISGVGDETVGVTKALFADSFLGDMGGDLTGDVEAGGVRCSDGGICAVSNTITKRVVAKSGALAAVGDGQLLCTGCVFDHQSLPGVGVGSHVAHVFSSDDGLQVWNSDTENLTAPSAVTAAVARHFLSVDDQHLQKIQRAAGVEELPPPPPPSPPPVHTTASPLTPPSPEPKTPEPKPPSPSPTASTPTDIPNGGVASSRTIVLLSLGAFVAAASFAFYLWWPMGATRGSAFPGASKTTTGGELHGKPVPQGPGAAAEEVFDAFLTHDWRGHDGKNHSRVQRVHESLKRLGVNTWFDEEEMQGDVQARMAQGIEHSRGVLVFVTQRYNDKVTGADEQDNCKFEFDVMMSFNRANMLPVVMENEMLDTHRWTGKMRGLAHKLYVSLVHIDTLLDDELDTYLSSHLLPQMPWLPANMSSSSPDGDGVKPGTMGVV